ncbi:HipA domain-containing protein [Bifidobacterium pullorum subsp. saeculare]|uniref:HipA domain-containing protein n=1 Tax=Bifidobacterium pullorum subsp. saeculare TaxID=78257 RepID=A0A939B929_9BIFI|nr:HipA family kinase [Bifidobacterium pullorum]MBM6699078.1 HipA domain-containing protein [Bifidobacterium pullorum subsp. saeculare]
MRYTLKLYDAPLLEFEATMGTGLESGRLTTHITWADDSCRTLLPFPLAPEPDDRKLASWLQRRTIPKNRRFATRILAQADLTPDDTLGIIDLCKGLSVNDSFWVERTGENLAFADINLFDNPLDETLAIVAYTGYTSSERHAIGLSSEWTTDGQFPKAWRHTAHGLELWKAGSEGAANAGFEPYAEFLASQLAARIGIPAVPYRLERWKGKLASVCALMNSKDVAFVPFYAATGLASFPEILACARALSDVEFRAMRDMLVFDALIVNQDRHANNYGLLRDDATGRIIGPAPLFDHNMALFKDDMRSDWEAGAWSPKAMNRLQPASSRLTFLGQARQIVGAGQHTWLRRALDVTLEDDPEHPIDPDRLAALNGYLHAAARRLLELPVVDEATLAAQLDALAPSVADVPVLRNEALLSAAD